MSKILIVEDNPVFREESKKRIIQHFPSAVVEEAGKRAMQQRLSTNQILPSDCT